MLLKQPTILWICGPEGGVKGGNIINEGNPEEICSNNIGYTAKFLKNMLHKKFKKIA